MNCYPIVDSKVKKHGGKAVYGWQVWEWPGVYLEAEFHAVWRDDQGALHDLTPKDQPTPRILFLEDPVRKYEGRFVANVLRPLSNHQEVLDFVDACNERGRFLEENIPENHELDFVMQMKLLPFEERKAEAGERLHRKLRQLAAGSTKPKTAKLGRNEPCHCGSGLKYKKCHLSSDGLAVRV